LAPIIPRFRDDNGAGHITPGVAEGRFHPVQPAVGARPQPCKLSRLGLAIKISADWPIEGFKDRDPIFSL
jgi:hypothetical protein